MALKVSLVSADRAVWSGDASLVIAKTVEGEMLTVKLDGKKVSVN